MRAETDGSNRTRVSEIDGIRGWASLCVLAYHVIWQMFGVAAPGLRNIGTAFMLDGPLAVAVFFVLSGDALSSAVLNSTKTFDIGQLMLKRYVRLGLPIAAVSLVIFDLKANGLVYNERAAAIVQQTSYFGGWLAGTTSLAQIADYAVRGVFFDATAPTIDRFLWTIPIEMSASFLIFVALAVAKLTRRPRTVAGIAYLVCLCLDRYYYVSCFFAGMFFAIFRMEGGFERLGARPGVACLSSSLVVLLVVADSVLHLASNHAATPLFAAALVFCALSNAVLCRAFAAPISRFLGRIAFSLYLVQFPILISATSFAIVATGRDGLDPLRIGLIATGSIVISLIAAALFEPIDRLAIQASRRIGRIDLSGLRRAWLGRTAMRHRGARPTPVSADGVSALPRG